MNVKISEKSQDFLIKISVFIILYLIFAKPVFNWLGITKSQADRQRKKVFQDPDTPFKGKLVTMYYKMPGNSKTKTFTGARSNELAAITMKIYNCFGTWGDNENGCAAAFYELKTKCEVSYVAYLFENYIGKDLLSYLQHGKDILPQNGLSDYDVSIIINYVNNLKLY